MSIDWTIQEVRITIEFYFKMLSLELNGRKYNKSQFRRDLRPFLNDRTEGSIEFKHQNISAVLLKHCMPNITGYQPRWNFQSLLEEEVLKYISENPHLENDFDYFSAYHFENKHLPKISYEKWLVNSPKLKALKDFEVSYKSKISKVNYIEREQKNQSIGQFGEKIAIDYEVWRLKNIGNEELADKIEWTSNDRGDGFGYDILSLNEDGSKRYIEVKTTKLGKEAPIFFSKNELNFSLNKSSQFYLYRIFEVDKNPRIFIKNGSLNNICQAEPINYIGRF